MLRTASDPLRESASNAPEDQRIRYVFNWRHGAYSLVASAMILIVTVVAMSGRTLITDVTGSPKNAPEPSKVMPHPTVTDVTELAP